MGELFAWARTLCSGTRRGPGREALALTNCSVLVQAPAEFFFTPAAACAGRPQDGPRLSPAQIRHAPLCRAALPFERQKWA
jgi:hypothetical protein